MLNDLNLSGKLKDAIGKTASDLNIPSKGAEGFKAINSYINSIPTNENEEMEQIIRKPFKTIKVKDLVGKKKMKKPIGKLTYMNTTKGSNAETTEATGAGSAGGYSQPLFATEVKKLDMFKDEQPKNKVKVSEDVNEKWSEKYKRSIDCNNPKGFSQKAHCQGRKKKQMSEEKLKGGKADKKTFEDLVRKNLEHGTPYGDVESKLKKQLNKGIKVEMEHTKDKGQAKEIAMDHLFEDPKYYDKLDKIEKVETKEATGAASAGQYTTNKMWAKSMNKKDWRGASKPQIPGGKFVQVKKKCKTFPYCNQGDIKALKIFENDTLKKVITKVSKEHNISESVIKTILAYEYEKIKNKK